MTPAARERWAVRTPVLAVSALAWIVMAFEPSGELDCHAAVPSMGMATGWAVMLVAMMLPVMATPLRHVRDRTFADRRLRAMTLFLAAYFAVWMAAGAVLIPLSLLVRRLSQASPAPAIATALAVLLWQAAPLKQVCLNRLHAHAPLTAFGARADVHALRFGASHGAWCCGSCWGIMLLPMLLPSGHTLGMLASSLWVWGEQLGRPDPPRWSLRVPARALRLALAQARLRAVR